MDNIVKCECTVRRRHGSPTNSLEADQPYLPCALFHRDKHGSVDALTFETLAVWLSPPAELGCVCVYVFLCMYPSVAVRTDPRIVC